MESRHPHIYRWFYAPHVKRHRSWEAAVFFQRCFYALVATLGLILAVSAVLPA